MLCVLGVLRETFSTTTEFITVIVATTITNIRYLREQEPQADLISTVMKTVDVHYLLQSPNI